MLKCCSKCKEELPLECFSRDNKRKDKLQCVCRDCCKKYTNENRERILQNKRIFWRENKARLAAYNKKRYAENKEKYIQGMRDYYAVPDNRRKKILAKTKERAAYDGIDFNLTLDDITIPLYCPYLGIELTHTLGRGQLYSNSSIDRIDPSKGYVKGNIEIMSRKANTMKSNATPEELISFAKAILERYT